ncbi:lipocalin-like domain-containing protein [Nocardia sp. NPDC049220]|uniref:lipocalin-like domain-containing protein n=1 Tax=Nocardia sp. NPDC049220 TaxID=3155273 RepID=UPI0033F56F88
MTRDELRNILVGAWRLVSYKATDIESGEVVTPFGSRPRGLIMYTADGHMSAQIMHPERPNFRAGRLEEGLPEELSAAAVGYMAYGGSYEVLEADRVVHHVKLSLFPNWAGGTQTRVANWDGERLRLILPEPAMIWGARRNGVLTWERAQ